MCWPLDIKLAANVTRQGTAMYTIPIREERAASRYREQNTCI